MKKKQTLESEFEHYKARHKYSILRHKLIQYYRDVEAGEIVIPDFLRVGERPEDLANKALQILILHNHNKFNQLYERAYQELAEELQ